MVKTLSSGYPDRFAYQPDKLETYHKLTAAINRAKDGGDIQTLREIADDPHGFLLRQGCQFQSAARCVMRFFSMARQAVLLAARTRLIKPANRASWVKPCL